MYTNDDFVVGTLIEDFKLIYPKSNIDNIEDIMIQAIGEILNSNLIEVPKNQLYSHKEVVRSAIIHQAQWIISSQNIKLDHATIAPRAAECLNRNFTLGRKDDNIEINY